MHQAILIVLVCIKTFNLYVLKTFFSNKSRLQVKNLKKHIGVMHTPDSEKKHKCQYCEKG